MTASGAGAVGSAGSAHRLHIRPRRLGLRARITLTFAIVSLVSSALLAGLTFVATRGTLLRQIENSALRQTYVNARLMRDSLRSAPDDVLPLISSLPTPTGANPLVFYGDEWFASEPLEFGENVLPVDLRRLVVGGTPARMRYAARGEQVLAIGVPLPSVDAAYFEVASLVELERTLRTLGRALAGAATITTLLGAGVGVWASRRALRPLGRAAEAAQAIAGGRLDTRLATLEDPDLALLATSFNGMAAALQQRIERDARFASDVSHELRSPLMTLSASIEVLQARRQEMPERAVAALDLMVADVARFQRLVQDLLEISRFDAGAARLNLEEVQVSELVQQAVHASSNGHVPVEVAPEMEDVVVHADKRRVVQLMANLLDNARLHAGGATRVSLEASGPDHVRIAVEDKGPGVALEERTLVFDRFRRGGAAGRRADGDGVGLGLALVAEHVRLHGGSVWVEDRIDGAEGSRFVVELPGAQK